MAARAVPKFIHHITAQEAESLLKTKGFDGSFLVRTSTNDPDVYALSYRTINNIVHIKFETTEEGFKAKNLPDEYPTIGALITEAQKMTNGLDYPLWPSDPAPEGLPPRMSFGRLASKHAEKILLDRDAQADRNFLIRSSTSHTDQLVLSVRLPTNDIIHILTHRQGDKILMKAQENERDYNNIKELIDHYMEPDPHNIHHADGTVIKLMKPMICPWNKDANNETARRTSPSNPSSSAANRRIAEEFETLQSEGCSAKPQKMEDEVGRRKENISKNRYKNILPYDETRVVLSRPTPRDYINANRLQTDERLGVYIGCQGPLPQTAEDHWQMIWQERCPIIVMLTNTVEAGKNKCHQYWPKDVGKDQMPGQFVIKYQEKVADVKSDYTISKLRLLNGQEEMTVFHCHYFGWPDKSVPKNIDSLVKFSEEILRIRSQVTDRRPGPIVAHCSAGIGRTGTYVLISMIINHIQMFGVSPDILSYTKQLREQRPGMVQTLQQYDLVHKAAEIYLKKFSSEPASAQYINTTVGPSNVYGNVN